MSSNKTNKSVTKRLKVRKSGKLEARKPGHGHYNSKDTGRGRQAKRRTNDVVLSNKDIARNLPHA